MVSQGTQGLVAMGDGVFDLFLHLSIGELEPLRLEYWVPAKVRGTLGRHYGPLQCVCLVRSLSLSLSLQVMLYERAMEAIHYARQQAFGVVLVDTAGRMQDNEPLMRSLAKVCRCVCV